MARFPKQLLSLIAQFQKLPGVGKKTAERFAFQLLEWDASHLHTFAEILKTLQEKIPHCSECGCLIDGVICAFCEKSQRDPKLLCVIATPKDAYAIEETGSFLGFYHVLGALLSPLDGKTPEILGIPRLMERIMSLKILEVILAFDSTLEGDATALFLKEHLQKKGVRVSRLALGLPVGSSLDFVDEGTLSQALEGRQLLH